jgi:quinoprotein glucose dehydrogenase
VPAARSRVAVRRGARVAIVLLTVAFAATSVASAAFPQRGAPAGEWPVYGGDLASTGYAPLDQINRDNVAELEVAWRWTAQNFGPRPELRNETTPLMIDGVLYATAGARRSVVAIDPGSGETLWMYRLDEGERGAEAPRPNSGRGVAYWSPASGAEAARVFVVTPGFHLIALDARNGRPVPEFGEDGVLDLMIGLRGDIPPTGRIGSSSPPVIVGNVVVVGSAQEVGMTPDSMRNIKGDVRGFDARTGELLWTFHTVPEPGEYGYETWGEGSAEYTGNAGVWAPFSADPELGYVYLPVEAATSDMYGGHRPGDNLFSSSLVCLDARTGERVWHFQLIHHDIWDWDTPTAPILVDIDVDGRPIKAVVQITKQAWAYVFDRVTGEPVWPIEERPVPPSDVPGEQTSPTQPHPTKPAPFDRQGFSRDDLIDFTAEVEAQALELIQDYRIGPLFTPPSLVDGDDGKQGTLMLPNAIGGGNWEGGAVDPETGMLYVGSFTSPYVFGLRATDPERSDLRYWAGGRAPRLPRGLPIVKPPWGRITGIDLNTGEHVWMIPNGDTPENIENHPLLRDVELPRTGKMSRAMLLVTKTLLFSGEGLSGGPVFRAHDKATGEVLAAIELPATTTGIPMTYLYEGRQYIVVAVGGREYPAGLVALALPD